MPHKNEPVPRDSDDKDNAKENTPILQNSNESLRVELEVLTSALISSDTKTPKLNMLKESIAVLLIHCPMSQQLNFAFLYEENKIKLKTNFPLVYGLSNSIHLDYNDLPAKPHNGVEDEEMISLVVTNSQLQAILYTHTGEDPFISFLVNWQQA